MGLVGAIDRRDDGRRPDGRRRRGPPGRHARRGRRRRRGPSPLRACRAWLPIIYGCDKTCTYCIVPFSRGPERSRPFDEIVDEARAIAAQGFREVTLLGQNVNSYGHDLAPEARFGHVRTERWAGRRLDLGSRPDLAELIRAIDGLRTADGSPAIPRLRFITSHPWDLSDRLIEAMADCPSRVRGAPPAGPVGRRRGAQADGPAVHDRALPRAAGPDPRGRPGHRDLAPTSSSASAARPRPSSSRPSACSSASATTRSSRPRTRSGRARPRRTSPTTSRPTTSAAA